MCTNFQYRPFVIEDWDRHRHRQRDTQMDRQIWNGQKHKRNDKQTYREKRDIRIDKQTHREKRHREMMRHTHIEDKQTDGEERQTDRKIQEHSNRNEQTK